MQPIEVVITVMRKAWDEKDYTTATEMAAIALPYTTPRLAATTITHRDALDDLNVDELRALLAFAERPTWPAGAEGESEADAAYAGKPH
jgi:hypothetical protein